MPSHGSVSEFTQRRLAGAVGVAVIILPALGAALRGRVPSGLFQFPPALRIPAGYPHFSWAAAGAVIAGIIACVGFWFLGPRDVGAPSVPPPPMPARRNRLPVWGVAAMLWTALWWLLAWTRWPWFEPFQQFTFFPLWMGFVVTVNALVERRQGSCLMRRDPRLWLRLFGASAICWWGFEWLNRFVHNWHYHNVRDIGPIAYAVHATLCFSTVVPAVAAVAEWIGADRNGANRWAAGPACGWLERRTGATVLVVFGVGALLGTGVRPSWCYPALWVGPLALSLGVQSLAGRDGLTRELARGDWTKAGAWMLAALVCGGFWELWNWHSLAKWTYTVPGVERWHVFEMPLLGYVGYLPFGLECLLVADAAIGRAATSAPSR